MVGRVNPEKSQGTELPTCPACGRESDWPYGPDGDGPNDGDYNERNCEKCGELYGTMASIEYRFYSWQD